MKIAIIGTGNIGSTLATHWAQKGHHLHLGLRDLENFRGTQLLQLPNTTSHSIPQAAQLAEVILVATPAQIAVDLAKSFGDLEGKIIIDATNAIQLKPDPYPTAFHAFLDLTNAEVIKCFNSTGFENMKNPKIGDTVLDMFMAGDSPRGKAVSEQLALECGFENCYDFGGNDKVELLEKFALSWINLAIFQGMGRNIGFKLVSR